MHRCGSARAGRLAVNPGRRRIVGLAIASLLAARLVRAQPRQKLLVIANEMPERGRKFVRETLAKEGLVEGRNLRVEQVAVGGAPPEVAEERARQAIALRPDVIFMSFGPETVLLRHLTRDIPIVFFNCPLDPMRAGLVASVARPGGNLTGTWHDYPALLMKRWALFREVLPSLKRAGWLVDSGQLEPPRWRNREAANAYARGFVGLEAEVHAEAEKRFGIRIARITVSTGAPEEEAIAALRRERLEALRIAFDFSEKGPLERYLISARILNDLVVRAGADSIETWRAAVAMLPRVLRGEPPATLPAIQGTRYVVKANPRMARAMGIEIPQSVLLQAEVIEG
jgi:putative ABC transport system substrate-binding protein